MIGRLKDVWGHFMQASQTSLKRTVWPCVQQRSTPLTQLPRVSFWMALNTNKE